MAEWGVLLAASSGALEVAVVGAAADGAWMPWLLDGDARAELPLRDSRELLPAGLAVSTCSTRPVPWGEGRELPPAPTLHVITDTGELCSYQLINLREGAAVLTQPPETPVVSSAWMTAIRGRVDATAKAAA